ncbi:hypothetical protein DYB28_002535 [Aphanomyces astaci]|uniref:Uncharacterized protein n=2 Tax=Aphanomyces astaci TaxID=112090 RepID=A0A3L6VPS7_APHAT|nr:hypothetical protein DYB26_015224 [Aphanomyces astaci]RLO10827.1 hypothetical protein DYB28_002535 [Aphanomyces astaci]
MAETVYANYRLHAAGKNRLDQVPPSMKFYPLRDLSWDNPSSTFSHPLSPSAATLVATKVRIGPLPTLTTPEDILAAVHQMPAPVQSTDLGPHIHRVLSSYVGQHIVQATAPLQQEVDTLRADKEALTALVSATSAAFNTLDARLLEERRLREAADHQQTEDQRTLTEAQNRLQTTVSQQGTHQEAMTKRLPIIESSLRTLMQAMQSASTQLTGLAALGTPPAHLPAAYPTQPPQMSSDDTPNSTFPPDHLAGPDDSTGTDPNDTIGSN